MKRSFLTALFAPMLLLTLSCERQVARTLKPLRPPEQQTEVHALAPNSSPALKAIIDGATDQIGKTTSYDPSYQKLDYPNVTNGTRWAAEARRLASKLTPEEEAEYFRRGMAKIYGGQAKEIAGAGH